MAELTAAGSYAATLVLDGTQVFKPTKDGVQVHGGSAILIPYAGRIREGAYSFEGRDYRFPATNGGHAIHGFGKDRHWRVSERKPDSVTFAARLRDQGYPAVLDARVSYSITPRGFSTACKVTNVGRQACPFVAGFHPYFLAKNWELSSSGEVWRYELARTFFPTGKRTAFDLRSLGPGMNIDMDLRAAGTVRLETNAYVLKMVRTNMPYLIVYNGNYADRRSVAVEPYSGLPDAFNNGLGVKILGPGVSFRCGYSVRLS